MANSTFTYIYINYEELTAEIHEEEDLGYYEETNTRVFSTSRSDEYEIVRNEGDNDA